MPKLLHQDEKYTFRAYFELPNDTDEVLAEFGYGYTRARLDLPKTLRTLDGFDQLKAQIEETLSYVQLKSDRAKREVLIAPVLTRVATICHQILRFDYPLKVNDQLQGSLDYFIRGCRQLIVAVAKRDDLTRGFTQLAVEMIALAMVEEAPSEIYGAVAMGNLWIFGVLDKERKQIIQDIGGYRVPDDTEQLIRVLIGILDE